MQTRREFLWSAGAALAAAAWYRHWAIFPVAPQAGASAWEPGVETYVNSSCLLCPGRCGIRGRVVDGRLVGIFGSELHPVSQGGICPRGIAGVQLLYHPERLSQPLERTGPRGSGKWRPVPPDRAVAILGERLARLRSEGRPEGWAVVSGYCRGTMEELWRQFLRAFGSPNYVPDSYPDAIDTVMGLMHGIWRRPGYDLERGDLVLSFGAPLFESWWSPVQAYVAFGARERGAAVHSLNVLLGSIARPGGVLFGEDPPVSPLPQPQLDAIAQRGLGRPPLLAPGPQFGAGDLVARFARAVVEASNPPEILFLYCANPLASSSQPDLWRKALERIPLVVSFSPFLDETANQADLVIPDLLPSERWQDAPAPSSYPFPVKSHAGFC